MRRTAVIIASLVFLSTFVVIVGILPEVRATTLYVGGSGPGNYTTIQDAIEAANRGDIIYVYSGTYYENVEVYRTLSLIGEDRDTTIIVGSGTGDVVQVVADWVNITGFTAINGGEDADDGGIELLYAENCYIANNTLSSNNASGIPLRSSGSNTIANNNVFSNGWAGISLFYHANRNTIIHNNVTNNGRGIYLESSDNNTVANNNASNNDIGIYIESSDNNTVASNNAFSDYRYGIFLEDANDSTVANNIASNNDFGIIILRSWDGVITDNIVSKNERGIHNYYSSNNTIANNTAISNHYYAIALSFFSDNNTVINNTATSNDWHGIALGYSDTNAIKNNTVCSNKKRGIALGYSDSNTITNNTICFNNGTGIFLDISNNNQIYHNNILDNTEQAYDSTDSNQWDNGYPSGGNYWSDYVGVDEKSGPNQDQPGSDGMGDTPYRIDWDSLDRYPLVSSSVVIPPRPPVVLDAFLSGKDMENVTLIWSLSSDDGSGLESIMGYEILRSVTYDPSGLGYTLITRLPSGTSAFVDNYTGEGDPNNYFYRVCAIDLHDRSACAENQAGKFTGPLSKGPHLVSIPLIQSNESIETVLQTAEFDKSWAYDSFRGKWKWYMSFKPYKGELRTINHTMGFWVNVTQDCNLTVAGIVPAQTSMHLYKGWNLVGFPSMNASFTVADLKAVLPVERVEGFDPAPPNFLRVLLDSDALVAGEAYWVRVLADTMWTVEMS